MFYCGVSRFPGRFNDGDRWSRLLYFGLFGLRSCATSGAEHNLKPVATVPKHNWRVAFTFLDVCMSILLRGQEIFCYGSIN